MSEEDNKEPLPVNPLLSRVEMPGSTYTLPSRGLFYTNGELHSNVQMGEVNVRPMAAFDEILLKSPDALFSGEAIHKVFLRCIPDVLKPTELLAKDVDFLLVCLKIVTFGDTSEVKYTHGCKKAKSHSYTVILSEFISKSKKIDPTQIVSTYTIKLPNDQQIKLQPSTFKNVIKMYQDTTSEISNPEEELKMTIFIISSIIESVDGITDRDMIDQWIGEISVKWLKMLSDAIENGSDFGPDFTFTTECKDCGATINIETPVNPISFFM